MSHHARYTAADELESFFSVTPDLVCLAGTDGQFTRVNPAWTELLGWSVAELTGRPYVTFIHPDDVEPTQRTAAALAKGDTILRFENRYAAKDGSYRWLSWRAKVDERTGLIAAIARDVTQRREAEERLKELNASLEHATAAKDAFLARMSHDLRTPLTAVVGFAQLLDSDALTPDQALSVQQILKAGRHLTQMIDEVLQVVRATAGAVPLSVEPLDLTAIVTEAVDLIRPSAARQQLQVTTTFPADAAWVMGDRQRTMEILLNLLSNGVKYNREGGSLHVDVTATTTAVRVSVTDTGLGLSSDQCARVFNPFERLDAGSRHIEGTGLGLALVKAMAALMGGTVGVESELHRGSTFWCEWARTAPLLDRRTESDHEGTASAVIHDVAGTLLYVDDTPSNLLLVGRLLQRRPQVVFLTAGSGADGIRLAQAHRPDLILLDFHLPDMDADEVMRRLAEDPTTRTIPVAILTADATRRSGDYTIAGQSVECLSKPIDMPRFVALIDRQLGRTSAEP